jgi:4-hydroxybenzoate polyprenyltransferase
MGFVAIAMVLFYTAGMYLNDLLDYAIDCRERPERPLPTGIVSRPAAVAVVIVLFGSSSILLWSVGLYPFLSGLVLIALIICYDRWHKSNPLSPLLMALCRGMVYVTAFLAFSSHSLFNLLIPGCLLMLYVIGLTYIAKTENKPSVANAGILATLFLPGMYFVTRPPLLSLPLVLLFTAWVAYSISFTYRSHKRKVGRTVGQLIAGISLLDSLVLTASGSVLGTAFALMAFSLALYLQRYVRGT